MMKLKIVKETFRTLLKDHLKDVEKNIHDSKNKIEHQMKN
jgi:hypothetical protein